MQTKAYREKNNTSFLHKLRKLQAKCKIIHPACKWSQTVPQNSQIHWARYAVRRTSLN